MGLWQRFTLIFKSKANKALDKAEDPRETLDYSYEKQLELLQKVRRGVADVATSRKRLELQIQGLAQQESKLEEQARAALDAGARLGTHLALGAGCTLAVDIGANAFAGAPAFTPPTWLAPPERSSTCTSSSLTPEAQPAKTATTETSKRSFFIGRTL